MAGHFERFWEMQTGGPHDGENYTDKIFKCKDCGAETFPDDGWNGEPDEHACSSDCPSRSSDWRPGRISNRYRANMDRVKSSGKTVFANKGDGRSEAQRALDNWDANYNATFRKSSALNSTGAVNAS